MDIDLNLCQKYILLHWNVIFIYLSRVIIQIFETLDKNFN